MGLRIGTNLPSMAASRALANNTLEQSKSYQRLASGKRIVSSADDAAGLAIGESERAQIRSMQQAERNANDSISLIQTAEGGMNEIGNMMIRLRELAIQSSTDTISDRERNLINQETQSILSEVDRISSVTQFNGVPLLNGTSSQSELNFHVGIQNTDADRIQLNLKDFDVQASALGVDGISSGSRDDARDSIEKVDEAIHRVSKSRSQLGAMQNKLQAAVNNIQVSHENLSQARSRVVDTDMAYESAELVRTNIQQQAGIAILSQANQAPSAALRLL